jgi:hypothetical protein
MIMDLMSNKIHSIVELFYTVPKGTSQIMYSLFYKYVAPNGAENPAGIEYL